MDSEIFLDFQRKAKRHYNFVSMILSPKTVVTKDCAQGCQLSNLVLLVVLN